MFGQPSAPMYCFSQDRIHRDTGYGPKGERRTVGAHPVAERDPETKQYSLLTASSRPPSPVPSRSPHATPAAPPSPILRPLSSPSQSRATLRSAGCRPLRRGVKSALNFLSAFPPLTLSPT